MPDTPDSPHHGLGRLGTALWSLGILSAAGAAAVVLFWPRNPVAGQVPVLANLAMVARLAGAAFLAGTAQRYLVLGQRARRGEAPPRPTCARLMALHGVVAAVVLVLGMRRDPSRLYLVGLDSLAALLLTLCPLAFILAGWAWRRSGPATGPAGPTRWPLALDTVAGAVLLAALVWLELVPVNG